MICDLYGDYLYDRRDFYDSALAFTRAGKPAKAMKAFEKAHAWRELFAMAQKEAVPAEEQQDIIVRVTGLCDNFKG